jgi:anti-anti-sigma factor
MILGRLKANTLLPVATVLCCLGIVITIGLTNFYSLKAGSLRREAALQQQSRAETIANTLEADLRVSQQVAESTSAVVAPLRGNTGSVEALLNRMIEAAPVETVYGIGVWFEPYVFAVDQQYFGPYVHRGENTASPNVLTYEWTTAAYNFPSQPWYQQGKQAGGSVVFTEPYFDINLVYITAAKAFYDRDGRFAGVVTVDTVLPQLRSLIAKANTEASEKVYVTTAGGAILVHPDEQRLITFAQSQGKPAQTVLDLTEDDLRRADDQQRAGQSYSDVTATVAGVGWNVHVKTDDAYLYNNVTNLRNAIVGGSALLWAALFAILGIMYRAQSRVELAHRRVEASEKQYAALFHDAPYPIFLVNTKDNRFFVANAAALHFYQYTSGELYALHAQDLDATFARLMLSENDQNSMAEHSWEAQHHKRDGNVADVAVTAKAISIDGQHYMLCHVLDITERNRAAEAQKKFQAAIIDMQAAALAELATPMIPITDHVMVMPLIGTLDQQRAQQLLETLLHGVQTTRAQVVIIDITGVPTIDAQGASALAQATRAVQLLGTKTVLTGIRPEVAQMLVTQSLDLANVMTYSTLQQGVAHTFQQTNHMPSNYHETNNHTAF